MGKNNGVILLALLLCAVMLFGCNTPSPEVETTTPKPEIDGTTPSAAATVTTPSSTEDLVTDSPDNIDSITTPGQYTPTTPNGDTLTTPIPEDNPPKPDGTDTLKSAIYTINALLTKPDPWEFLPDTFRMENMVSNNIPSNYGSSPVRVSDIQPKMIGKQMNVLYTTLNNTEEILFYTNIVFDAAGTVAELYQRFLNDNPDNPSEFHGEIKGFIFTLNINKKISTLTAGNGTVSLELWYDFETDMRGGYIRLTDGAALRYESGEKSLHLAYELAIKGEEQGFGYLSELQFERDHNRVIGRLHEYLGTKDAAIKTSAVIDIDSGAVAIISDKRESDDLHIDGYLELYDAKTGEMIGGEVAEKVASIDYDTFWFNLYDISGISTVKAVPAMGEAKLNADYIYINGSSEVLATKNIGGIGLDMFSRRYDIEMREVWYVVAETNDGKVSYKMMKAEVPMIFVQFESCATLGSDMKEKNPSLFSVAPSINQTIPEVVNKYFTTFIDELAEAKKNNTYDEIDRFING